MELVFIVCFVGVVYLYIGYFVCILFLGNVFEKKHSISDNYIPNVSIIIPTKNEELTIKKRIQNLFELDYPRKKLQILVVDSSSDDATQKIVQEYKGHGIELVVVPHKGKAYAMQEAINNHVDNEITISTDANAYFLPDALKKIVRHFSDDKVGGVTGFMHQSDISSTIESEGSSLYWKMEKLLRVNESKYHSSICMSGEMTCFKTDIVKNKKWYYDGDGDDFDMSLFIIKNGYRIIFEPEAKVWEKAPDISDDVEKQKVRIIVQTISAFTHYFSVLFVARYGFILFSHKFLALFSPLFFIGLFISNAFFLGSVLGILFFFMQVLLYLAYISKFNVGIFRITNFLILLNILIFKSYFVYLSGRDFTKWDKIMSSRT